jgi:Cof subfamily protein (haloacid dehalogenase superfamily)
VTRFIASDLDGTLLQSSGTVSEENLAAIKRAFAEGLDLIFVTGRPTRWMDNIAQMTGHSGLALCANGAVLFDLSSSEIVHADLLPGEIGLIAVERLRSLDPDISFAVEIARPKRDFLIESNYRPRWETQLPPPQVSVDEMFNTDLVVKLLARPSAKAIHNADSFLAAADEVLAGIVDVTHSDNQDVLIEMSMLGVNKGSGLARVAAERGFTQANVAAIGDMPNDIPMIQWAGIGAAVANAHDRVKAVADLHLPSNDEHAFSHLVDHVINS